MIFVYVFCVSPKIAFCQDRTRVFDSLLMNIFRKVMKMSENCLPPGASFCDTLRSLEARGRHFPVLGTIFETLGRPQASIWRHFLRFWVSVGLPTRRNLSRSQTIRTRTVQCSKSIVKTMDF